MRLRLVLLGVILGALAVASVASAQYVGGGSIGAAGGGGGGAASVLQNVADGIIDILDTSGTVRGEIVTRNGAADVYFRNSGGSAGTFQSIGSVATAGSAGAIGAGSSVFTIADSINSATGGSTVIFRFFGEGVLQPVPGAARTITSPTDTTTDPVAGGTSCRMSSSGAAAWTPSESNGVTGMFVCCTNTGANAITMTDSDGVYEGPGSVVGQWDTVCMEYVTDRWVERSFSDNEP